MSTLSGSPPDPRRIAAGQRATQRCRQEEAPRRTLAGYCPAPQEQFTMTRRFLLVGVLIFIRLFVSTSLAMVLSTVAAVAGTVEAYRGSTPSCPMLAVVTVDTFQTSRIYDRADLLQGDQKRQTADGAPSLLSIKSRDRPV
ncbi:MAG: hypothetical protein R2855_10020 [Thermomicrobiales bacterium]